VPTGSLARRPTVLGLALLCSLATATGPAGAAGNGSREEKARACRADWQRFCATVAPGGGRIRDCMKAHLGDLAPACRAVIEAAEKR
jgi:hypothetical protein